MISLLFAVNMSYGFFAETKIKYHLTGLFGQYVPKELVAEMSKNPENFSIEGESREMTVLFSDVRGFTTISEGLQPRELTKLMNEYMTPMTHVILKYRGTIDKYIGDAIMAIWGAPLRDDEHARNAILAALDMQATLDQLRPQFTQKGWPEIRIGVGINSGIMRVGNMGSEFRMAYTIMGDPVNLGSRLEGMNKEYDSNIIISEFTYNTVKKTMCCRELDWVRVKGKKLPVKIYELLGEKDDESRWKDFIAGFEKGLALYRAVKWDEAITVFQKVLTMRPEDEASKIYIERCFKLKEEPPAQPWDGVFTMKTK